jgi:beta-glucosidase
MGATFSRKHIHAAGELLALEAKARGAVCLLAPTINIQRSPLGGRAFESYSEDPTLSGHIAAAYVNGLQEGGVSATIKHFVGNDQEHERMGEDSVIPERALRELYLRPFQIAQKDAKPWAYMTSYNKVNGTHVSENPVLLRELLRKEWGHEGLIMSDWYVTPRIMHQGDQR